MPKIYESPDKGKTIFMREFGEDPKSRVELTEYMSPDPAERDWEYDGHGTKIYKPSAGKPTPTLYEK